MKEESWKKLKEDENYLISSWGRIYSLKTEKFISPYFHKSRCSTYLRVCLMKKKFMVHSLVANNFINKDCSTKNQVEHNDNNTLNNNADNLKWVTQSENQKLRHLKNKRPTIADPLTPKFDLPNKAKLN